ncbi:MAG: hypothetical protein AAF663_07830 [Planctomycetota bacterium]
MRRNVRSQESTKTLSVPAVSAGYVAQAACWAVASGAAIYLMIRVGTAELAASPVAVAGLFLLGLGLIKQAKSRG